MTQVEQAKAAKEFAEYWQAKGDEKQHTQQFWNDLLRNVLGVEDVEHYIEFEKKVRLSHTSFIDAYIPLTKVLIEQKGSKIDLHKAYEQSDGSVLTPYQQAKRYADEMPNSIRPDWIVVCNFTEFLVYNMEKPHEEPVQILLKDLPKDAYLLNFLVQHKTDALQRELELSIEAGKIVGELYDELLKQYKKKDDFELKSLNMLCVRLVFCLYAEDSGIFGKRLMFHDFLASFNAENVREALQNLFKVLDQKPEERDPYMNEKYAQFPYVNGGLFKDEKILIPPFNDAIRDFLLNKASSFDWSEISPTIFGAVFESTLNPETRRSGGMHYTSIENIHRVIDPLFMDALNAEFEEITGISVAQQKNAVARPVETTGIGHFDKLNVRLSKKQKERLLAFQKKLGSLTFLDPACGSGNFLTETYLSLRRLENRIISLLNSGEKVLGFDEFIQVKISQFYGIEINDFAVTVAKTALWIAESQMISETEQIVSRTIDFLPLTTNAFIVEGNALRMDWSTLQPLGRCFADAQHDGHSDKNCHSDQARHSEQACHSERSEESLLTAADTLFANFTTQVDGTAHHYDYIMGNPPFVGHQWRSKEQQSDMETVFADLKGNFGKLDYVAAWYKKACDLMQGTQTQAAFVSTNSICQGESVATMWKPLFEQRNLEITFAWQTFIWNSESFEKAHVHCVIVGFSSNAVIGKKNTVVEQKVAVIEPVEMTNSGKGGFDKLNHRRIFAPDGTFAVVKNINGYLLDAPNLFIESRGKPLTAGLSKMSKGSQPTDGGNLILSQEERTELLHKYPQAQKLVRQYISADDFINGKLRYCLWLKGVSPNEYSKIKPIIERLEKVREMRLKSPTASVRRDADTPMLFTQIRQPETDYLVVPEVSSENRRYIPIGFLTPDVIASNKLYIIENASLYLFGILISNVHMAWMRITAGRLKSDYSYSPAVYNNFPFCSSTDAQKAKIEETAKGILDAREKFPEATLADLYNELTMPSELRRAHQANDRAVMEAYGFAGTRGHAPLSEAEIVGELFKMYEKLEKGE